MLLYIVGRGVFLFEDADEYVYFFAKHEYILQTSKQVLLYRTLPFKRIFYFPFKSAACDSLFDVRHHLPPLVEAKGGAKRRFFFYFLFYFIKWMNLCKQRGVSVLLEKASVFAYKVDNHAMVNKEILFKGIKKLSKCNQMEKLLRLSV